MKRINIIGWGMRFFLIVLIGLFALSSCKKNNGTNLIDQGNNGVGVSSNEDSLIVADFGSSQRNELTVSSGKGTYGLSVVSNVTWKATSNVDWIKIINSTGKGKDSLHFSVDKNTESKRTGRIAIKSTSKDFSKIVLVLISQGHELGTNNFYVKEGKTGVGHSWNDATNIANALKNVMPGDTIFVSAGTYHPTEVITNGNASSEEAKTFEISKNITLLGGYPSNATGKAIAKPELNKTILSGDLGNGDAAYHVVVVSAPKKEGKKVTIGGFIIKDGENHGDDVAKIRGVSYDSKIGGGLYIAGGGEVLIKNVIVKNNNGVNGPGDVGYAGAVSIFNQSEVTFKNCSIDNNSNIGHGGGLQIADGSNVSFHNCEIKDNNCDDKGGGIIVYNDGTSIKFFDTEITGNTSKGKGAGILMYDASEAEFHNSKINGNESTGSNVGGLEMHASSVVDMYDSEIKNNVSSGRAGGVELHNSAKANFHNTTISGNKSKDKAGGILMYDKSTINFYDSKIKKNQSTDDRAGGIMIYNDAVATFHNSDIIGNKSKSYGGGLVQYSSSQIIFYNSQIKDNHSDTHSGGVFENNGELIFYNTVIKNNDCHGRAPGVYLEKKKTKGYFVNCLITGNTSDGDKSGGGVFIDGANAILISSTIAGNDIQKGAGGVYQSGTESELQVYNSIITENTQKVGSSDFENGGGQITKFKYSIIDTDVYDKDGNTTGDSFKSSSLNSIYLPIAGFAQNNGMDESDLSNLSNRYSVLEASFLKEDINKKSRSGKKIMGALVE